MVRPLRLTTDEAVALVVALKTLLELPGLAERLSLPPGWRYRSHIPEQAIVVDTRQRDATVTQDDLANTYSLIG